LYRTFDSLPSSFAQIFDACRETTESATYDSFRSPIASNGMDSLNTLEQMFESIGGLLYRQAYGTK
jgi:hypothetical protein